MAKQEQVMRRPFWHRERTVLNIDDESPVQGSHAEAADVNNIVRRYQQTGELPKNPRGQEGQYMDVTPYQQELTEAYNKALDDTRRLTQELEDQAKEKQREAQEKADKEREATKEPGTAPQQPPADAGASPDSQPAPS